MNRKNYPRVVVSAFIFNKQGKLLLVKSPKWRNQYLIPGGHLNYLEKLQDCCQREVNEETGLKVGNLKFFTILEGLNPPDYHKKNIHFIYLYFLARAKDNQVVLDSREGTNYLWVKPLAALKLKKLHPSLKKIIQKIIREKYV